MENQNDTWDVVPFVPLPFGTRMRFSYRGTPRLRLPAEKAGELPAGTSPDISLAPGTLVRVPFGHREATGLVWGRSRHRVHRLKSLEKVLSKAPLFSTQELRMLERLAYASLEPLSLLAHAATRVREPLKHFSSQQTAPDPGTGLSPRSGHHHQSFQPDVLWNHLSSLLPSSADGQVLILVPETALAPDVLSELEQRSIPAVFFAQTLPLRTRRRVAERLASGEPLTVVSTHAGVFLPFPTLSRIVVAEASLPSHRQWDLHPRYDARVIALLLARSRGIPLTLQTSLPSLDLHLLSQRKNAAPFRTPNPSLRIRLLPRSPSEPILSRDVMTSLREILTSGGSAFLFHDVVGTERLFGCGTCGFTLRCELCGGMTERAGSRSSCRTCGTGGGQIPAFCPICRSPHIGPRRTGTAALGFQLRREFPDASILRADRETLPRTRHGFARRISSTGGSIMLGSERAFAVLSGRTFDRAIIASADRMLEDARFDASERFAVLVYRLAWYVKPTADILLQTAYPHLPVVRALTESTMEKWITEELADREQLRYPPHTGLLHLTQAFPTATAAKRAAEKLVTELSARSSGLQIGFRTAGTPLRAPVRFAARVLRGAPPEVPRGFSSKIRGAGVPNESLRDSAGFPRGAPPRIRADILLRGHIPDISRARSGLPTQAWDYDPLIPLSEISEHGPH